jgi:outer membrane protein TolC
MLNRRHRLTASAIVCLSAALAAMPARAQAPEGLPVGPLTLEQVLALAETRSESIAISRAGVQRADAEHTRARSDLYPQLSAAASYDRSLASEFEGVFESPDFGDTSGFEDLPFGRANTWRMSLALTQNIYSGGRIGAQAAVAAAGRDAAGLNVSTTRAQLLFDVTQAYYDAALTDQLVRIAEETLDQARATLQQTQAGFNAGTQPEFEVVRATVARDNQTPLVIRQRMNREIALLRLKQLLDLPQDFALQLADALGGERLAPPPAFEARVASLESSLGPASRLESTVAPPDDALGERTAVNEVATIVRLREASMQLTQAQRNPAVTFNSTYTRVAYPSEVFPAFDRANWTVGASVSVPILTGGRQRADEQVARAELEQARLQLRQTQELAALDSRAAWAELLAARATWEASAGTVQQATRAYQIADVRYQAGVSTQLELSDSRLLLQQAEANRARAARDLQVARARMALLPDLPIGASLPQGLPAQVAPQAPAVLPVTPGGVITNAAAQGGRLFQVGNR